MVRVGKWTSLYACNSLLSFSPPSKSQREYATISISNLICNARYLTGLVEVSFLLTRAWDIYFPSKCSSNVFKLELCSRILLTNKEPISWILGTYFNAWKLHLHLNFWSKESKSKYALTDLIYSTFSLQNRIDNRNEKGIIYIFLSFVYSIECFLFIPSFDLLKLSDRILSFRPKYSYNQDFILWDQKVHL